MTSEIHAKPVNMEKYIDIFQDLFLPSIYNIITKKVQNDYIFVILRKKAKGGWKKKTFLLLTWPSSSLDFSPIESLLGKIIRKKKIKPTKINSKVRESVKILSMLCPDV